MKLQSIAALLMCKDSIGEALYGSTVDAHALIDDGNTASLASIQKQLPNANSAPFGVGAYVLEAGKPKLRHG
jgi:hypothetical protein